VLHQPLPNEASEALKRLAAARAEANHAAGVDAAREVDRQAPGAMDLRLRRFAVASALKVKDVEAASAFLAHYEAQFEKDWVYYWRLGQVRALEKRFDEAYQALRTAFLTKPEADEDLLRATLLNLRRSGGTVDEVGVELRKLLDADRLRPLVVREFVDAMSKAKRYRPIVHVFRTFCEGMDLDGATAAKVAVALEARGERGAAVQVLDAALERLPSDKSLRRARERLDAGPGSPHARTDHPAAVTEIAAQAGATGRGGARAPKIELSREDLVARAEEAYRERRLAWARRYQDELDGGLAGSGEPLAPAGPGGPSADPAASLDLATALEVLRIARDMSDPSAALGAAEYVDAADSTSVGPRLRRFAFNSALALRQYQLARHHLDAYDAQFGPDASSQSRRGDILAAEEKFDAAYEAYKAALDRTSPGGDLLARAATCLTRTSREPSEVEKEFRDLLSKFGRHRVLVGALFQFLGSSGQADRVVRAYEDLRDEVEFAAADYVEIVEACIRLRKFERAAELVDAAVARFPSSKPLRRQQFRIRFKLNDRSGARDALYEAIGQAEEQAQLSRLFRSATPQVPYFGADLADAASRASGEEADAASYTSLAAILLHPAEKLLRLERGAPRETPALRPFGAASTEDARRGRIGLTSAARLLLGRALQLDPNHGDALEALGELLKAEGDVVSAAAVQERAYIGGRNRKRFIQSFASTLLNVGRTADAIAVMSRGDAGKKLVFAPAAAFDDWLPARTGEVLPPEEFEFPAIAFQNENAIPFSIVFREEQLEAGIARRGLLTHEGILLNEAGSVLFSDPWQYDVRGGYEDMKVRARSGIIYEPSRRFSELPNRCVFLAGAPSHYSNYFHAIGQNFSRAPAILDGLGAGHSIVLPTSATPWLLDYLNEIGVPRERVVQLEPETSYTFDELVVADAPRMTSIPTRAVGARLQRQVLGDEAAPAPRDGLRLFFSRELGDYARRELVNEPELVDVARRRGFEVLDPGTLSIRRQMDLMASASVVCAPTGAALTNLLFGRRGLRALCLSPSETCRNYYPGLAAAVGQDFTWCLGHFVPEGRHSRDFPQLPYYVDTKNFSAALDHVLKELN
jgi:tetratricopeptide (TPR) repeat protein